MFKIAVIAGTPVDTRMGVEYIEGKNGPGAEIELQPVYMPVSEDCDAQVRFQYSDDAAKKRRMDEIFDAAIADGIEDFFIYCNSLSGAFDFDTYAVEKGVRIYTPLQQYHRLGQVYSRVGVIAANNLSAYNIEKHLRADNEDIYVIGSGNMAIVNSIEHGLAPEEIIEKCGLRHFVDYLAACGSPALLLGCTHFPYLKEELRGYCRIPLVDPADEMYKAMTEAIQKQHRDIG